MHWFGFSALDGQLKRGQWKRATRISRQAVQNKPAGRLRPLAAIMLTLATATPPGFAQQGVAQQNGAGSNGPDKAASNLPGAPVPIPTEPFDLRSSERDFSKAYARVPGNPINIFLPT